MKHISTHSFIHSILACVVLAAFSACWHKPALNETLPPAQTIHHEVIIVMPPPNGKTVVSSGASQPPPKEVKACP